MNTDTYTTYAIRDPQTGLYVYVGQTLNFEKRKRSHLKRDKKKPRIKTQNIKTWLFQKLSDGLIPEFVVLEMTDTEEKSLVSEFLWVRKLKLEKYPLLNRWKIHTGAMQFDQNSDEAIVETANLAIAAYLANRKPRPIKEKRSPFHRKKPALTLDRTKQPWNPSEDLKLLEYYAQDKGGHEIAELLRRPFRGVCARLVRLGVVPDRASVRE